MTGLTQEQKNKRNERQRLWRIENPEKVRSYRNKWHENNPEANKNQGWRRRLEIVYKINPTIYEALLIKQDNKCAICRLPEKRKSRYGKIMRLAVDHDHDTGKIRGLLCASCNVIIGQIRSEDSLSRAILYLRGELDD